MGMDCWGVNTVRQVIIKCLECGCFGALVLWCFGGALNPALFILKVLR